MTLPPASYRAGHAGARTLALLGAITEHIAAPFLTPELLPRVVVLLNANLKELVEPTTLRAAKARACVFVVVGRPFLLSG